MKHILIVCSLILLGLQSLSAQEPSTISSDLTTDAMYLSDFDTMVDIVVFPNPTKDIVSIASMNTMDTSDLVIKIINSEGNKIKMLKNLGSDQGRLNVKIDLSAEPEGMYHYFLYDGDALITQGKIVKE